MPALRPVFGVSRVSFRGTSHGAAIVNVFHVLSSAGALTTSTITTLAQGVRSAYEVNMVTQLNGNYSADNVFAVDLSTEDGAEVSLPLGGTPGVVSQLMPQSAACCITWKIGRHYRGGHPRTYLGPLPGTAIETPTSLTSTYAATTQTKANNFLTAVNAITVGGGSCQLVAVHRWRNKEELATPLISPITSAVVDTRIDTMRRRLGPDR